jgi:hypothetical protein
MWVGPADPSAQQVVVGYHEVSGSGGNGEICGYIDGHPQTGMMRHAVAGLQP